MYRKRLVCAAYAPMNITADQTRRLMYIVEICMAKKHHMTKHQYVAYKKTRRQYNHSVEAEQEEIGQTKSNHGKYSKKREKKMKNVLRNIQGNSGEILDEEYDDG